MTTSKPKIAIVFPADPKEMASTRLAQSRFVATAAAFTKAGADVIGAPYADPIVAEARDRLLTVDGVLV